MVSSNQQNWKVFVKILNFYSVKLKSHPNCSSLQVYSLQVTSLQSFKILRTAFDLEIQVQGSRLDKETINVFYKRFLGMSGFVGRAGQIY